jgi:hypothetical protein
MRLVRALAASLALAVAAPASAVDFCFVTSPASLVYEFPKLKLPKAGAAVSVAGIRDDAYGVSGTFYRTSDGTLRMSVWDEGCLLTGSFDGNLGAAVTRNCTPVGGDVTLWTWTRFTCGADL